MTEFFDGVSETSVEDAEDAELPYDDNVLSDNDGVESSGKQVTGALQTQKAITKHSGYLYGPVTFVYTGKACKPTFSYINYGQAKLLEGIDYELSYKNNRNVGIATMTVTGIGEYYGSFNVSFKIMPYELQENEVPIIDSQLYSGSQIQPSITVLTDNGILTEGKDYAVKYGENTEPEKEPGTVVVTGIGNYSGKITRSFTINKVPIGKTTIKGVNSSYAYTGEVIKPEPKITYNGMPLLKGRDYTVQYGKNTSLGNGYMKIAGIGTHFTDQTEISFGIKKRKVFDDVKIESHPYYKAIYWAVDNDITKGYTGTNLFGIDDACTRGQAVQFLWRLAGKPEPPTHVNMPFSDVPKNHAYYKAIMWASDLMITKGFSDKTFGINKKCTRGQIVTFIWRYKGCGEPKSLKSPFVDSITKPYYKAVLWAAENSITGGFQDYTFRDTQYCTRGQILTFLYRMEN